MASDGLNVSSYIWVNKIIAKNFNFPSPRI